MNKYKTSILIAAPLLVAAGCGFDGYGDRSSSQVPPTSEYHTVTVTSIGMVNKDSGEALDVEGLPVSGGVLIVD